MSSPSSSISWTGRLGRIGHGELRGWSALLSRKSLKKAVKQLKVFFYIKNFTPINIISDLYIYDNPFSGSVHLEVWSSNATFRLPHLNGTWHGIDIIMSNEHHHYEHDRWACSMIIIMINYHHHDQWSSSSSMNIMTLLLHLFPGATRDARAVHAGRAVRRERGNVHLVHAQGRHRHPHPRLSNVCHCSGWYSWAELRCSLFVAEISFSSS